MESPISDLKDMVDPAMKPRQLTVRGKMLQDQPRLWDDRSIRQGTWLTMAPLEQGLARWVFFLSESFHLRPRTLFSKANSCSWRPFLIDDPNLISDNLTAAFRFLQGYPAMYFNIRTSSITLHPTNDVPCLEAIFVLNCRLLISLCQTWLYLRLHYQNMHNISQTSEAL